MLKKINEKWMKLDPANQYLIWISSFAFLLALSVLSLVLMTTFGITEDVMRIIIVGVSSFSVFFTFVVLFLTVIWPHYYKKQH